MKTAKPFLIYKSSAGSGKTTALINIFLSLILSQPDPDHFKRVLAITFTNKATNEMKSRLLEELIKIACLKLPFEKDKAHFMLINLLNSTSLEPAELKRRAENAFVRILFDYGDLSISTIDRFNHKLIRAFSKELDLRADFAVELDDKALFKEAVIRLVERVGHNEAVTDHLTAFIASAQDEERRAHIMGSLEKLRPLIMNEEADAAIDSLRKLNDEMFIAAVDDIQKFCRRLENDFRILGREGKKLLDAAGATAADLVGKSNSWYNYFEKCLTEPLDKLHISITRRNNLDKPWAHKSAPSDVAASIEAATQSLVVFAEKAIELYDTKMEGYVLRKAILKNIHLLGTLNELREVLEEITSERNILPIKYFNRIVSRSLRDEPVAFIYENIGTRYDNILIDEFQDTSSMQWLNLLPLVGEALATDKTSLVVGDAKQSIYRWRGGKAEQLIALPEIDDPLGITDPALKETLRRTHHIEHLNTNYRSTKRIVDFNNALFKALKPHFTSSDSLYEHAYDDVAQEVRDPVDESGYVEVNYLGPKAEESVLNDLLLQQILELQQNGVPPGDVCILVRSKKTGTKIAEFLEANDFSVTTSDSRSIDADGRVQLVTALMTLNVNPDHNPAKISVIRSLSALHKWPFNPDKYRGPMRNDKKREINLHAFLTEVGLPLPKNSWFAQGAYQACETLIRQYLPESRTATSLTALLNYIIATGGMNLTTEDFITHWNNSDNKPGAGTIEDRNSIQMMTIHKSKGLQFRVVIVPYVNWKLKAGENDQSWVKVDHLLANGLGYAPLNISSRLEMMGLEEVYRQEKEANLFDNLNLIYVALTRAVTGLYINYSDSTTSFIGSKFKAAVEVIEAEGNLPSGIRTTPLIEHLPQFQDKLDESASRLAWGTPPTGEEKTEEPTRTEIPKLQKAEAAPSEWFGRFPFAYDPKRLGKNISQKIGIFFHRLAAETSDLGEGKSWIDARSKNGELDLEEASHLNELAKMLYTDEKYKAITSAGRRFAERELVSGGEVLRPDLVFETDTTATVIDFKTGEENVRHHMQVSRYKAALQSVTGKPTKGYLLYLDPMMWVDVDDEISGTAAPGVQTKLF